jgi:hypothetical protein
VPVADAFTFRSAPNSDAFEWPGTTVGVSNTITRVRGPIPAERQLDPQRCAPLVRRARRGLEGTESYVGDAIIHGVRVRLFSDSHHVGDFWTGNWLGPQEWRGLTGQIPPERPRLTIYAMGAVKDREPAAFICPERDTILILGSTWYGTVRDLTLAHVGRILAEEEGAHLVRASAAVAGSHAVLSGTSAFALMQTPGSRFLSHDAVIVRYAYRRRAGGWVAPIEARGSKGWRVFEWIDRHAAEGKARVRGILDDGRPIELDLEDLALAEMRAFAYLAEARAYAPTGLVREFPAHTRSILRSKLENAPEAGAIDDAGIDEVAAGAAAAGLPPATARDIAFRLVAYDGTRALLDPEHAFGRARIVRNPWEPAHVGSIRGDAASGSSEGEVALDGLLRRCAAARVPERSAR